MAARKHRMTPRLVALAILLFAFCGVSAPVVSATPFLYVETDHGDYITAEPEADWAAASAIPTGGAAIRVVREPCPFATVDEHGTSCARRWRDEWRIWLAPHPEPWGRLILLHELFHIRDDAAGRRLNPLRASLRRINGWGGKWAERRWPSSFPGWRASPKERAADAAAWCGSIPRSEWAATDPAVAFIAWPGYLWQPSREQFVATCRLLSDRA